MTVMLTPAVVLPAPFVKLTTYDVAGTSDVGVPVITPVRPLSASPGGREGATEYEPTGEPLLLGTFGEIGTPTV